MLAICLHGRHHACMSVQITIRDVPDGVRDELAARAAREGKSMQEYLRNAMELLAAKPTPEQWVALVRESKSKGHCDARIPAKKIVQARDKDRR